MRLHEGAACRCRRFPGAAARGDGGEHLLDLVQLLEDAGGGHLEPAAVGGLETLLGQAAEQVFAAAQQVGPLQLEGGRACGGFPRQQREPDPQAGEDGGQDRDRRCESQVAVSCSTRCR